MNQRTDKSDFPRKRGGGEPLSRRASKRLVIGGIIVAILLAALATVLINRWSENPAVREAVEEFQRQESGQSTAPADTGASTSRQ